MYFLDDLQLTFSGKVLLNERLANYTSLKLGGPADVMLKPETKADVVHALQWINKYRLPFVVIGFGTNILVSDAGVRGVVLNISDSLKNVEIKNTRVYAEAGISLPLLVLETLKAGLAGIENLGGVPGTLGGGILMNAGAYGRELFDVIDQVEVVRKGQLLTLKKEDIHFEYRKTDLKDDFILAAHIQLTHGVKEDLMTKRSEMLKKRRESQPLDVPNAGSMFKNPPGLFAGVLIESCGLKGFRIGGVSVSVKHANFLVNDQNGTASDMMNLINYVKNTVFEKHKVQLEMEVKLVGFP